MDKKAASSAEKWRNYFRRADCDIFGVIEHAIMVAASDCPNEFKVRRDQIAEKLFTVGLVKCHGCDDENYDDYVVEALTDEIEEESQIVGEVYRIKEILNDTEQESDSVLFDSLRRLQLMGLTVDTLKTTEIGKAVIRFRKHGSQEIRSLARTLIDGWKDLVDEWVNASNSVAATINCTEGTPDSVNPSVLDEEEGLPSPPLDDLLFFTTQPTSMELTGFFDGMDEDGNPRNIEEVSKNCESVVKQKFKSPSETSALKTDEKNQQKYRKHEVVLKPTNKPTNAASEPERPSRVINEMRSQPKPTNGVALQKRPVSYTKNKLRGSDEDAVQVKLEATKRKLQERYQQAENAKKQRTIQFMEIRDLPKQNTGHRNPHAKPAGNQIRHRAHARR